MKMWNPLNYLGYGSSPSIPIQQTQSQIMNKQICEQKNIKIRQKYLIQQHSNFHKRIKQFEQLIMSKSHNEQQNNRLVKIFSHLIHSLEQFMSTMTQIKKEYQQNLVKIQLFDSYQRKIENHNNIVQNLIESHQKEIQTILTKSKQQQIILQTKLTLLDNQLQQKTQQLTQKEVEIEKLKTQNQQLRIKTNQLNKKIQQNKVHYTSLQSQLQLLNSSNKSFVKNKLIYQHSQTNPQQKPYNIINFNNILLTKSQLTTKIFSYLDIKTIFILFQLNKTIHSIVINKLPNTLYQRMKTKQQKELQTIKNQSIYFNHILYDQLDTQNTKINAIKYLFFNHKPGTYILTMFQQDITKLQQDQTFIIPINQQENSNAENTHDQPKKSWKSFFKYDKTKKDQTIKTAQVIKTTGNLPSQQKFSLAQLKNSQTFKKIQQQLSKSFHQHVFSLKLPKDLESFGKLMTEQFLQLRKEISTFNGKNSGVNLTIRQWTSKLLTLSKFLYLQSQQLWGLSQSVFAKHMQFQQQNHELRSEIQDLTQNQTGMRKLVEQLARNKIQMQKRIWQSQRKSNFLKSSAQNIQKVNQKLENEIQSIRSTLSQQQNKSYQLQKQLAQCKEKLSNVYKKYKQKMEEFAQIKQQIAKISWI